MATPLPTTTAPDWLGACRRATEGLRTVLRESPTSQERVIETGERGEGGDRTLVIDAQAEQIVFAELDALYAQGHRFSAISEERGEVDYGDPSVRVVIDPIDGSLNAKRGLAPHALSIAVAHGPTMGDVVFGFVHDLGTEEEWSATLGAGAFLDGVRIDAPPERHMADGRLEVLAIESADPRWVVAAGDELSGLSHRLRALGSTALSLCQVATTRVDGMVTLWRCRSVDAAAAQLVVRESGGCVAFPGAATPLGAPLDLEPHHPVVAARSPETLARLVGIPVGL
jgi:myo-inositol-1(or 4)-monophosphatase